MNIFDPVDIRRVDKPWGHELIWAHTSKYVGKLLHVSAGQSLSLQYHEHKEETLFLIGGDVQLTLEEDGERRQLNMTKGQAFHIHPGLIHRITALADSDIIEVSTIELDDVVRLEDRYGRAGTSAP